jgi:hypothetical protein
MNDVNPSDLIDGCSNLAKTSRHRNKTFAKLTRLSDLVKVPISLVRINWYLAAVLNPIKGTRSRI